MRIISQKCEHDVPYEYCALWVKYPENIIYATLIGETDTLLQMAKYSTQEKAEKAIQMLHSYYRDYMIEKVYKQEIRSMWPVFQFPAESMFEYWSNIGVK